MYPRELNRRLENLESVCARSQEALLSSLPVDHVPDVLHVRSLAVQVLFVVSSDTKDRGCKLT